MTTHFPSQKRNTQFECVCAQSETRCPSFTGTLPSWNQPWGGGGGWNGRQTTTTFSHSSPSWSRSKWRGFFNRGAHILHEMHSCAPKCLAPAWFGEFRAERGSTPATTEPKEECTALSQSQQEKGPAAIEILPPCIIIKHTTVGLTEQRPHSSVSPQKNKKKFRNQNCLGAGWDLKGIFCRPLKGSGITKSQTHISSH